MTLQRRDVTVPTFRYLSRYNDRPRLYGRGIGVPFLVGEKKLLSPQLVPCGGGVEYLHRSPESRRRRRNGNPVPGGITGPPCSWGI
jgi:hypothetical protein